MTYRLFTIEDDEVVAEDLRQRLCNLGYFVLGNASSADEACQRAIALSPDLIIVDINIQGSNDGIGVVSNIRKRHACPAIYLTGDSDVAVVKRALATGPAAFLLKPVRMSELSITIDLAVRNFRQPQAGESVSSRTSDSIYLPENLLHYRVRKEDILFAEADGAYVKIFCKTKEYVVSINLKNFQRQLDDPSFVRVSRKHLVNSDYIGRINGNALYLEVPGLKERMIAMSKDIRLQVLNGFNIIKTKRC